MNKENIVAHIAGYGLLRKYKSDELGYERALIKSR